MRHILLATAAAFSLAAAPSMLSAQDAPPPPPEPAPPPPPPEAAVEDPPFCRGEVQDNCINPREAGENWGNRPLEDFPEDRDTGGPDTAGEAEPPA